MWTRIAAIVLALFFIGSHSVPGPLYADTIFQAILNSSNVPGGTSSETGTAIATFVLDDAQQNLSYSLETFGLDLKLDPVDRVAFSDVDKIHLHNGLPGGSGPHVLNIFGLPSEDDSELVVDYINDSLTGVYNDADAIDTVNGGLFDQNNPLTTKLFSNFSDDLVDGQLYIAIHTAGQNGNIAIRGQIIAVPEPCGTAVLGIAALLFSIRRRRK